MLMSLTTTLLLMVLGVTVNTGGGLISFGHPVGATGAKQVHEIRFEDYFKAPRYDPKMMVVGVK